MIGGMSGVTADVIPLVQLLKIEQNFQTKCPWVKDEMFKKRNFRT